MSLCEQQPTVSQGNNSRTSHHQTSLKIRKNTKSKQSLTRRSSGTRSSTGSNGRDMRKQLGNLQVTLDEQKMQSKTLSDTTWEAISLLTDMAMAAKLGKKTRPMANAFMNFYDKKFKPVLQNIPAQRDRSTQTARVQDGGIQNLGLCRELGLANALRPTAVEMDEQYLDRKVIDLTGNKDGERTGVRTHGSDQEWSKRGVMWCRHHRKAWTTVQAFLTTGWTSRTMTSLMTLTHTWNMARDTRTGWHLKMLFTNSGAATQLTCGVTHTMTHDDSQ